MLIATGDAVVEAHLLGSDHGGQDFSTALFSGSALFEQVLLPTMLVVVGVGESNPRDVVGRFGDQPQIVGPAIGSDEHVGIEAWGLWLQYDERGSLRAF